MRKTAWMVRLLKRYGNCYVRKIDDILIESISLQVGAEISINKAIECNGYILKVKK